MTQPNQAANHGNVLGTVNGTPLTCTRGVKSRATSVAAVSSHQAPVHFICEKEAGGLLGKMASFCMLCCFHVKHKIDTHGKSSFQTSWVENCLIITTPYLELSSHLRKLSVPRKSSGLSVASSAAVFWDVTQSYPKETAAHIRTTFFSFCVCGLFELRWTDQSHNSKVWMT